MKKIEDMSVDEISDLMGSELSVSLFKGDFKRSIIRWAMYIYQLNLELKNKKMEG